MAIKSGFSSEDLARMGPDPLTRRRMLAEAMLADASRQRKIDHPLQGMAQLAQALVGGLQQRKFDRAEAAGRNSASATMNELGAALAGPSAFPPAPTGSGPGSGAAADYPSQRVAQAFGDTNAAPSPAEASGTADWLSYANQGATRNQPLNDKLVDALSFLPDMGVSMKVFSGGQPSEGPNRVGSHRHDHGGAGDAFFYKDGRQLDWANADDRPIFEEIVKRGRAAGVTGFGAGDGYMQPGSMHIGFGNPGVWGAGGKGENAPDWLRSAFAQEASQRAPVQVASNDPRAAMAAALTGGAAAPLPSRNIPDRPIAQMAQAADPYNSETLGATPIPRGGPDMQMLTGALGNEWLNPAQRSLVESLIGQKMQANDPAAQLDMEYKRAQIEALKSKAAGAGATEFGLNPQYGVDANNNPVLIQIGKDGKAIQTAMPEGVSLSKEPIKLDAGTHFVLLDPISRQPVGTIPKENREAARQTAEGTAEGKTVAEQAAAAPGDYQAAQNALDLISSIRNDPARERGTGKSSIFNAMRGTSGYDFEQKVEQAKSGAFLSAIQQMRGLGALSNTEGTAATAAITRMNTALTEEGFLSALDDYEKIVRQAMGRAGSRMPEGTQPPPATAKRLKFNPATGDFE